MYLSISHVLSDRWAMFYHPAWPTDQLRPLCDIHRCIHQANTNLHTLGRTLSTWPAYDQDQIARLLWVNWIYTRLPIEPIRKPIVTHREKENLIVDCGDTRLMALSLCSHPTTVSVIVTDHVEEKERYAQWIRVFDNDQLLSLTKFGRDAHIDFRPGNGQSAFDWFEIGDQSTAQHLHDISQRLHMMQNYLDHHPDLLSFDISWVKSTIDWSKYSLS